ncbi:serine aminopeptidase domain-containing protein, partial [Serratia liquefaciens]|uniref:serine aminopeptidase domain-containing protein n=1 Tax=Serratia liquefaciens TaxID=614 RepID=UPI00235FBBFA
PPPYVALGHSMGAHILLRHAAGQGSWFERLVLTAPFIAVAPQRYPMPPSFAHAYCELGALAGLSGHYVPGSRREPIETWPFEG